MSGKTCRLLLLALTAVPSLLFGQGTITSVTGDSPNGAVNGITANTPLPNGFTLTLAGTFNTSTRQLVSVTWSNIDNPSASRTFSIDGQILSASPTQIQVTITPDLFSGSIFSRQTVEVYETENVGGNFVDSNHVNFYINPGITQGTYSQPADTVSFPYPSSAPPVANGGTAPYSISVSLPPGMSISPTTLQLTGTPTANPTPDNNFVSFQANITDAWGMTGASYNYFYLYPKPVITPPLVPSAVGAGSSGVYVNINGQGFVLPFYGEGYRPGSSVRWSVGATSVDLTDYVTVVSPTLIQVWIPSNLLALPCTAMIQVVQPDDSPSNGAAFTVAAPAITSLSPSSVTAGAPGFTLTVNGAFFVAYVPESTAGATKPRAAMARPRAVSIPTSYNSQVYWGSTLLTSTVVNSNTITAQVPASLVASAGSAQIKVVNPGGISSNAAVFTTNPQIPPLTISGTLPQGTVNVSYGASIGAAGGVPPYQFSIAGGSLPPGLKLGSDGTISGTPTQAGQYSFTVQVNDSKGENTSSAFSIKVVPPPLSLVGSLGDLAIGAPVNAAFSATGGVPPYTFSAAGSLPSGTSFSNATITGTPNSPGTFQFTISVRDNAGTVVTKSFSVKVTVAPLSITGSLGNGQVAAAYSGQVGASGGVPPYSFSADGMPPGTSLSSGGVASGPPTAAGTYSVTVTATDAAGAHVSQSFSVTITAAALNISGSLGNGTVGSPYSASLTASGGTPPYSFNFSGLPNGVSGSSSGAVSGTPSAVGTFQVTASVTDSKGAKGSQSYTVTITLAPLTIASNSLPSGVVGTAISGSVSASGGVPPYQFSASGLPGGVGMNSGGSFSGTPTSPGAASVTITVTDSKGATASKTLSMSITLPSNPNVNFSGLPDTTNPASQPTASIGLGGAFPVDVAVDLTMTFAPDSGADDPAVQFSTGGRTAHVIIPAGATVSPTSVGVQTGTVAGLITITAHLKAAGQDITGTPIPTRTIRVNAAPPTISSVTATRNSTGFTVTVTGFASSREITQATFQFTAATGTTLQTSSVTIPVDSLFTQWYQNSASAQFGSQFTYTQPFTVSGGAQSIVSVSVTLASKAGTSTAVSANLQ